jgi:predicted SprT family Zn-dependent metalloprotease
MAYKNRRPAVLAPTTMAYAGLTDAYNYFNDRLWKGKLPPCLITYQRHRSAYGYFAPDRFSERPDHLQPRKKLVAFDEIALNPSHFHERNEMDILSTLVHEMCHLWQHRFGQKKSKGGYHNREWAAEMHRVGLDPKSIDRPGQEIGFKVTHKIDLNGRFLMDCAEFLEKNKLVLPFVEVWTPEKEKTAKAKRQSKTKYTCPHCEQNAWAKPGARLICGDCEMLMEASDGE